MKMVNLNFYMLHRTGPLYMVVPHWPVERRDKREIRGQEERREERGGMGKAKREKRKET